MTYFNTYATQVQQTLIQGNEVFVKSLVLFSLFIFSFIYLVYWKKHCEEKTYSWAVGIGRLLFSLFGYIYLAVIPFILLVFDPSISLYKIFIIFFSLYGAIGSVTLLALMGEVIYVGNLSVLKLMGMDIKDKRVRKVVKKFTKGDIIEPNF